MVSSKVAKWRPREILKNWLVDRWPGKSQHRIKPEKLFQPIEIGL
jgi:hypothetical protein